MKKLYLLLIPLFAIILTGCGSSSNSDSGSGSKQMVCTRNTTSGGVTINLKYTLKHDGTYVTSSTFYEEYIPQDTSSLSQIKDIIEQTYTTANQKYSGYTINVNNDGQKVVADVTVDYSKTDLEQMRKDDSDVEQFIENGKMSVEKMKTYYKGLGMSCE